MANGFEYHLDCLVVSYEIILYQHCKLFVLLAVIDKYGKEAAVGEGNSAVQNI